MTLQFFPISVHKIDGSQLKSKENPAHKLKLNLHLFCKQCSPAKNGQGTCLPYMLPTPNIFPHVIQNTLSAIAVINQCSLIKSKDNVYQK